MMLANLTNRKRKRAKETKNKEVHRKRKKRKRLSKKGGKKRHKGLKQDLSGIIRNYATNAMSLSSLSRIEVENRHFHIPHSDTTIICTSLVHPRTWDRILQLDSA